MLTDQKLEEIIVICKESVRLLPHDQSWHASLGIFTAEKERRDVEIEATIRNFLAEYGPARAKDIFILCGNAYQTLQSFNAACYRMAQAGMLINQHGKYMLPEQRPVRAKSMQAQTAEDLAFYMRDHEGVNRLIYTNELATALQISKDRVSYGMKLLIAEGKVVRNGRGFQLLRSVRHVVHRDYDVGNGRNGRWQMLLEPKRDYWEAFIRERMDVLVASSPHWRDTLYRPMFGDAEYIPPDAMPDGTFAHFLKMLAIYEGDNRSGKIATYSTNFMQAVARLASHIYGYKGNNKEIRYGEMPFVMCYELKGTYPQDLDERFVFEDQVAMAVYQRRPLIAGAEA